MAKLDELVVELKAIDTGLQAAIRKAGGEIDVLDAKTKRYTSGFSSEIGRLRGQILSLGVAWGAFRAGRAIIDAGMQMEAMRFRMQAATGDANVAAVALDYVRSEADRLGLDLATTANGFASFSASALRAGLNFQETKDIFTGVSEAASAMRLSGERVQLVFMALSQMASKGKVSMEELRQQLGESLPSAIQLFAKAMRIGNPEFIKMVENGKVTTRDLIKLGHGLRDEFGAAAKEAATGAQASFNKLGNAWLEIKARMASSGFLDAIANSADNLTKKLNEPAMEEGMRNFGFLLGGIAEAATDAAGMLANFLMKLGEVEVKSARLLKRGIPVNLVGLRAGDWISQGMDWLGKNQGMAAKGNQGGASHSRTASGLMNTGPSGAKSDDIDRMFQEMYASHTLSSTDSGGGGEDAKLTKLKKQLADRVDALRQSLGTENEQANLQWSSQQKTLEEALEKKVITEQQFRELNLKNEMEYQERLEEIRQEAEDKQITNREAFMEGFLGLEKQRRNRTLSDDASSFRQSISQAAQHNKIFFEIEKAASLARASIAAAESVVSAYRFGSAIGGPILGAAFAGVAAAAQAANIAAIASSSYGGGASSVGSSGGGYVAGGEGPSSQFTPEGGPRTQTIIIEGRGENFTKNQIRELVVALNDTFRDGTRLVLP